MSFIDHLIPLIDLINFLLFLLFLLLLLLLLPVVTESRASGKQRRLWARQSLVAGDDDSGGVLLQPMILRVRADTRQQTQKEVTRALTDAEFLNTKFREPQLAPHMIRKQEADNQMDCESFSRFGARRGARPPRQRH